jgi:hypothetical protein
MNDQQASSTFNELVQKALRHELISASGRTDAFRLAWEAKGNVGQIEREIEETEARLTNPTLLAGPMATGATPQIYQVAYLRGLRDALDLILQAIPPNGAEDL